MFPMSGPERAMPLPECNPEYPLRVTSDLVPGADHTADEVDPETEPTAPPEIPARRMGLTYFFGRMILAPLARVVYRPRIEGKANVPRSGPVIFASNHLSFIDSIVIPVAAPRPVHFLAKASYFNGTGFKGWLSREFFTAIGA